MKFIAKRQSYGRIRLRIGKNRLEAKLADTFLKKMVGLMYLPNPKENECMLFVFGFSGRKGIWMRNMKFCIDAIWLDERKRVVHIEKSLRPCKSFDCKVYASNADAKYVIELRDGFVSRNKVKINDVAEFSV